MKLFIYKEQTFKKFVIFRKREKKKLCTQENYALYRK